MEDPAKGSAEGPAESFPVKIRGTCPRQNVFSEQNCSPPHKQRARTKIFMKIFMRALFMTGIITMIRCRNNFLPGNGQIRIRS